MNSTQSVFYWVGKILLLGVIFYFGIEGIIHPALFAAMVPAWLLLVPASVLVVIHGVIMSICAILVMGTIGGKWPIIILIGTLCAVLISVSGNILARDIAIVGGVFLLLAEQYQKNA